MAKLLLGREVTDALNADLAVRTAALRRRGIVPTLAIIRIGENPSDLSYERGATKRAGLVGVEILRFVLPETASRETVLSYIDHCNREPTIHGVLLLRPLPAHLRPFQNEIFNHLDPAKDVDCMTHLSNAGILEGSTELGFAPCTPAACMEILSHYGIDCSGKSAVVIGRSLVVGKPAALMLMERNATVTVCHTKTPDPAGLCRQADIIVSAAGKLHSLTRDFVRPGQIVIDVSINYDPEKPNASGTLGGISGDACFEQIEPIVAAITPVPGGVGSVTTSVLMKHVVEAAERKLPEGTEAGAF